MSVVSLHEYIVLFGLGDGGVGGGGGGFGFEQDASHAALSAMPPTLCTHWALPVEFEQVHP